MNRSTDASPEQAGSSVDTSAPASDWLGTVGHMVVEFAPDAIPVAGFDELLALVYAGTVRIVDMEFVTTVGGKPSTVAIAGESFGGDLAAFAGAHSGLLDERDLATAADGLDDGNIAAVIIYEIRAMLPVVRGFERSGATVTSDAVDIDDILNAAPLSSAAIREASPR